MWTDTELSSWSPSLRVKRMSSGELLPPAELSVPALKSGANWGPGHGAPRPSWLMVKSLEVSTTAPLQAVNCALVVYVPQVGGFSSGARGPSLNARCKFENGSCGLSSNVEVSWPVAGSASIFPGSLRITPGPLATR